MVRTSRTAGEPRAECSKRPDISPAQPRHAETRLVPSKATASEVARRTLRYVEPLSDAKTPLGKRRVPGQRDCLDRLRAGG